MRICNFPRRANNSITSSEGLLEGSLLLLTGCRQPLSGTGVVCTATSSSRETQKASMEVKCHVDFGLREREREISTAMSLSSFVAVISRSRLSAGFPEHMNTRRHMPLLHSLSPHQTETATGSMSSLDREQGCCGFLSGMEDTDCFFLLASPPSQVVQKVHQGRSWRMALEEVMTRCLQAIVNE